MRFRERLRLDSVRHDGGELLSHSVRNNGPSPFDVLIRGGKIVDGTGNPWFLGDVAIRGDRIEAVGPLAAETTAHRVIDATRPGRRPRVRRHALAFGHDSPRRRLRPEQDPPGSDDRDPGRGHLGRPRQGEAAAAHR